jgi:hypothetical protein
MRFLCQYWVLNSLKISNKIVKHYLAGNFLPQISVFPSSLQRRGDLCKDAADAEKAFESEKGGRCDGRREKVRKK